jgi:hypothetical protein
VVLFSEKVVDDCRDPFNLFVGQFRINGQTQTFARGFFGNGKIAGMVSERTVAILQVERHGIMEGAADLMGFQVPL